MHLNFTEFILYKMLWALAFLWCCCWRIKDDLRLKMELLMCRCVDWMHGSLLKAHWTDWYVLGRTLHVTCSQPFSVKMKMHVHTCMSSPLCTWSNIWSIWTRTSQQQVMEHKSAFVPAPILSVFSRKAEKSHFDGWTFLKMFKCTWVFPLIQIVNIRTHVIWHNSSSELMCLIQETSGTI